MSIDLAGAVALNKLRNDFLRSCTSQGFPQSHIKVAWSFVNLVTSDHDLRASDEVLQECIGRAHEQLNDMKKCQGLDLTLSTAALESNFKTLSEVVIKDKAALLLAVTSSSEGPGNPLTPATTETEQSADDLVIFEQSRSPSHTPPPPFTRDKKTAKRRSKRLTSEELDESRRDAANYIYIVPALKDLMSGKCKEYALHFWDPVDPVKDSAPDYFDVIKHPMDLEMIKEKYNAKAYTRANQVKADIELMLSNCFTYNDAGSEVYELGKKWEAEYHKVWDKYFRYYGADKTQL